MATSPNNKPSSAGNKTANAGGRSEPESAAAPAEDADVKRKLAWRMGFAGLMIVGLLGALALFDRLSAPGESEPAAPQFTEPVPVAKKVITQPVTPAEPAPEPVKEAEPPPPAVEVTAAPVDKAAPRVDRPPRAEAAPAPQRPAPPSPSSAPSTVRAAPRPAPAAAVRNETPMRTEPAPTAEPPTPPRLFSGYALQAGVFADPRRAEELHARLVLEGIPASIESRVQVGPFKDRAEAEAVREKMKAMGIDTVLLPPKGSRR